MSETQNFAFKILPSRQNKKKHKNQLQNAKLQLFFYSFTSLQLRFTSANLSLTSLQLRFGLKKAASLIPDFPTPSYSSLDHPILPYTLLYFPTPSYTSLHFPTLPYTSLHPPILPYTLLYFPTPSYTSLHPPILPYTLLYFPTHSYTSLHPPTLPYTLLYF